MFWIPLGGVVAGGAAVTSFEPYGNSEISGGLADSKHLKRDLFEP